MNEIFTLRNIPCALRNLKDLESQLPKSVHYRLENITYKGRQLWQQLPKEIKKVPPSELQAEHQVVERF